MIGHRIGKTMDRRETRKPLVTNVAAKIAQKRFTVGLSDISCRGCRIVSESVNLRLGERVTIRPEGMESLTGTIRWALSEYAGFEFDYPLHPAVVDHLCRTNPS